MPSLTADGSESIRWSMVCRRPGEKESISMATLQLQKFYRIFSILQFFATLYMILLSSVTFSFYLMSTGLNISLRYY